MKSFDVVVVGSAHVDYNILLPHLPVKGETVIGEDFYVSPGGKGANQAVSSSRLGARTSFIGRVGDDENGRLLVNVLRANSVDVEGVIVDADTPTGIAMILVEKGGENIIAVYPGTDQKISPRDLDGRRDLIENSRVLLTQLEIPVESVKEALVIAKKSGVKTVLNVAPFKPLSNDILELVDVIILNDVEASQFSHSEIVDVDSALRAARAISEKTGGEVIITMGERGAVAYSRLSGESLHVPAFKVKVVDTVAAGDAFSAAYAVSCAEDKDLRERLVFSVGAASLKVTRRGAISGLPFRSEVERLLAGMAAD